MKSNKIVVLGILALLPLAACAGNGTSSGTSAATTSSAPVATTSTTSETSTTSTETSTSIAASKANGVFTYAAASYAEKAKILGKLEGYAMDNFLCGIPMYDSGGNVLYADRLEGLLDKYIPNYGFGVGRSTITSPMSATAEPTAAYQKYYHGYQTSDPASYNAWSSTGSVESDMMDMYALGYYGTKPNAAGDNYEWTNILAKAKPIALNRDSTTNMATKWKVQLHFNEDGYVYNTLSAKPTLAAFKGTKIALEDYLEPFKRCLDYQWTRSTDLASNSSGFAGVQAYADAVSAGKTADWSTVGIQISDEKDGLVFTFNTPKSDFYAMYDLASSLYSPVPAAFYDALYKIKADKSAYGIFSDTGATASGLTAVDSVLSCGVYMPEYIEAGQQLVFKKNPTCCIADQYHFEGYKEWVWTGAATDSTYAYTQYKNNGNIDAVGVPSKYLSVEKSNPQRRITLGDTTWKLNVNSCTQEQWNGFFGAKGTIKHGKDDGYKVKPIMSNKNFLNGLYYSINRSALANYLGRNPTQGFFADAYMIDPEKSISYRSSDEGKAVLASRSPDTIGYSLTKATELFRTAVQQEQAKGNYTGGTVAKPVEISLSCIYQSTSQVNDEGILEKGYMESAFNSACSDLGVKLTIETAAGTVWSDVYYKYLMLGQCDLGFGSISGNTLDPLNFMDTLKSNNTTGFTLNWGKDTSVCDYDAATNTGALEYDNKFWSYDALYAAGNSGGAFKDGCETPVFVQVDDGEVDTQVSDIKAATYTASVAYSYYVDPQVTITIDHAVWYNPNTKKEEVTYDLDTVLADDDKGTMTFTITVDSTKCADAGLDPATDGVTGVYGYLSVYYTQTVAGVQSAVIESDILCLFYQVVTVSSSSASAQATSISGFARA